MELILNWLKKKKFCKTTAKSPKGVTENSFIIKEKYKNISDPVQRAIMKFESNPSISLIKK